MEELLIYLIVGVVDERELFTVIEDCTGQSAYKFRIYGDKANIFSWIVKGVLEERCRTNCFMCGKDEYLQLKTCLGKKIN